MSILNQESDGQFNILIALSKCLVFSGSMSKEKLIDLCAPKSLIANPKRAKATLNRWIELGLFQADDVVSVAEKFKKQLSKKNYCVAELICAAANQIFEMGSNDNFWYSEENKSADFCRAQAWMLAQDVYSFQPTSWKEVEALAILQGVEQPAKSKQKCTPETPRVFGNDTRWNGFTSWSEFLGFGNTMFGHFSVDPTKAIRAHLLEVVPAKESLPVTDFVDAISSRIPVLDGGVQRKQVEDKIDSSKWEAPKANELSPSFSRSLIRLNADNTIELENKADAKDKRILVGKGNAHLDTVSHIRAGENLS